MGIKTALNKAFIINKKIKDQIITKDPQSAEIIENYTHATDIKEWSVENRGENFLINTGYDIEISQDNYFGVWEYLNGFFPELEDRKDQGKSPYNLRPCSYYESFHLPKIIFIHTAVKPCFYYDNSGLFVNNNAYIISNSSKVLSAILNSNVFSFIRQYVFAAFGDGSKKGRSRLNYEKMCRVPIPKNINPDLERTIDKAVDSLNEMSNTFLGVRNNFLKYISNQDPFFNLSNKLKLWYELEFGDFLKELNKAIKASNKVRVKEGLSPVPELTKKDEFEWMELFEEKKKEAVELQQEIEKTDKEIDQMVYKLYGLTEEEIGIVEGSVEK